MADRVGVEAEPHDARRGARPRAQRAAGAPPAEMADAAAARDRRAQVAGGGAVRVLKSVGCHGRVANRVLNVPMAQIVLNGSGVMPMRSQIISTRMSQLVGMRYKRQTGYFASSRHNLMNRTR
jgi:hypothetical protein